MSKQKVWFVTGAAKGFGFEIVKAILESGDAVAATVRSNPEQLEAAFDYHLNLLVLTADVTNESQIRQGIANTVKEFGGLDVIVNNAGFGYVCAIEEASDEEAKKQYETNVFGVLNVVRAALPQLRKQRSGYIINFTSYLGYDPVPGYALYGSTKSALEGLSIGLAAELAPFGIRVTALAPGLFRTQFLKEGSYRRTNLSIEDYEKTTVGQMKSSVAQLHGSQMGDPAKLAQVVVRLADETEPPLHLPVGLDALEAFRKTSAGTSREVENWVGKFPATELDGH